MPPRTPAAAPQETTLLHHIFSGYKRGQTMCTSCHYVSRVYEPLSELLLDVPLGSSSLEDAMAEHFSQIYLDDDNKCAVSFWKMLF